MVVLITIDNQEGLYWCIGGRSYNLRDHFLQWFNNQAFPIAQGTGVSFSRFGSCLQTNEQHRELAISSGWGNLELLSSSPGVRLAFCSVCLIQTGLSPKPRLVWLCGMCVHTFRLVDGSRLNYQLHRESGIWRWPASWSWWVCWGDTCWFLCSIWGSSLLQWYTGTSIPWCALVPKVRWKVVLKTDDCPVERGCVSRLCCESCVDGAVLWKLCCMRLCPRGCTEWGCVLKAVPGSYCVFLSVFCVWLICSSGCSLRNMFCIVKYLEYLVKSCVSCGVSWI